MKFATLVIFSAVSVAAASRQLQDDGTTATCAPEGERSQQCGAINPDRPEECCPGLECQFAKCVDPGDIAICAPQGEKALECGVNQPNRPDKCCEGLVCDALKTCAPIGEVPTAEPTVFVPPTVACAGVDERAQDCGAMNTARPQSCCGDLVCGEGASVRCIDPNAPVPAPTADAETAPVAAPTVEETMPAEPTASPTDDFAGVPTASMTVEPSPLPTGVPGTPEPTTEAPGTSEPTEVDDTSAPTDVTTIAPEPTPTSAASKMAAVTAAVAVVIAAPLLF